MNVIQKRIVVQHAEVFAAQLRECVEAAVSEMRIGQTERVIWVKVSGIRYLKLCGIEGVQGSVKIHAETIAEGLDRLEIMLEGTGYEMTINDGGEPCITEI